MKLSCLQENLSKGLQTIMYSVPAKSSLPILSNVLIATENGRIKLSSTNLETAITTYVGASVEEEGSTTIPARLLKDFISNLPAGTINMQVKDEILAINSKTTKSKFNGSSAKDFPELPSFPKKSQVLEIDATTLNNAVNIVAFAAGTDTSRPVFTGIYFNYSKGKLTITSTDGFRLSEKILNMKGNVDDFSVVIPAKTIVEVAKIFVASQEPISFVLNQDENLALFKSEDTLIATRILDGQYPDYKKIIPSEHVVKAIFNSPEFTEAVRLTDIFAKESNNTIKIRFDPEGKIKITSLSEETGQHESNLNAEIEGELVEIAFNSKYLLDFLNNIKSEKINFASNGNVSPCVFTTEDQKDFIHIVMPMQI
ncbi:DNA polymerase III subunit beta [candidate division WWE3 bacterium]|uniref:Beta sliding clamp n=2 Tax=candidate division WWE3 bacterium TaxID=2053526 RepID=A0A7X9E6N4_UNCKA|nr:DNA polymerase III subunit beta [candidate division WWE3 bacterium]